MKVVDFILGGLQLFFQGLGAGEYDTCLVEEFVLPLADLNRAHVILAGQFVERTVLPECFQNDLGLEFRTTGCACVANCVRDALCAACRFERLVHF